MLCDYVGRKCKGEMVETVSIDWVMYDPIGHGKDLALILNNGKSLEELKRGSDVMLFTSCSDDSGCCMVNRLESPRMEVGWTLIKEPYSHLGEM